MPTYLFKLMKYKTLVISTFVFLVLISMANSSVYAEDSITPTLRPRQEMRRDIKEVRQENKQERQQALSGLRLQIAQKVYDNILNRFNHRLTNLNALKTRIQQRLDTKKATGKDIVASQDQLNKFNVGPSSDYQNDLTALDTLWDSIKASSAPLSQISDLKKAANKVNLDLNAQQQVLVQAYKLMAKL